MSIFNKRGCHAIHLAAQKGHANIIEHLVNDCDVNIDLQQNKGHGNTAYLLACRNGHLDCIKFLSSLNPDREYFNEAGCHAIHLAAINNHCESVKYLVDTCGIDINLKNNVNNSTPLSISLDHKYASLLECILKLHAKIVYGSGLDSIISDDLESSKKPSVVLEIYKV